MGNRDAKPNSEPEVLIGRISDRARNLFVSRQMLCAEAVVVALNHGLSGGLTDVQAAAMAAPFSVALGDSGCLCGALSGAVMSAGLLLGQGHLYYQRKVMRSHARHLHDTFKNANGTTCCRVLSNNVRHDKKAHFQQCADLTAQAAEMAARLILEARPDLYARADNNYLTERQSTIGGTLWRLMHLFLR
jgi:C_GCAxxG_C_C family probable redox protein